MKRAFTRREKILLILLSVVVLCGVYFRLFFEPAQARIAAAQGSLSQAQSAVQQDRLRLGQIRKMQDELQEMKNSGAPASEIPDYDNIGNVMVQLGSILETTSGYQLKFAGLKFGDLLISRPVQITFTAADYASAKKTLSALYGSKYRCALSGITVTTGDAADPGNIAAQKVSVTLTATFYEKYQDAAAKKALQKSSQSSAAG